MLLFKFKRASCDWLTYQNVVLAVLFRKICAFDENSRFSKSLNGEPWRASFVAVSSSEMKLLSMFFLIILTDTKRLIISFCYRHALQDRILSILACLYDRGAVPVNLY